MRIPRIHVTASLHEGEDITLDNNAANHITRVLRLKPGAPLILFNGKGGEYQATITSVERHTILAKVEHFTDHETESPLHITLIQGISRGERMDYTLQKSVELGIQRIIPLLTERCGVKLESERLTKRMQHWQGVVTSACEQCGRNRLPDILPAISLYQWLSEQDKDAASETRLVLDHRASRHLKQLSAGNTPITLLVGPEGGLSEQEIDLAQQSGFIGIALGPRILRTETAAVAALASIQTLWGDLA